MPRIIDFRINEILNSLIYQLSRLQTEVDKKVSRKFAAFLRDDGVFLIRMMQKNSNEILVSELVSKLWDIFLEKKMVQKLTRDGATNGSTLRSVS